MKHFLLIDVGGTWMRVARSSHRRLLDVRIVHTPRQWSQGKQELVRIISRLFAGRKISAVVIGVPGKLNTKRDRILSAPNLHGWERQPVVRDLRFMIQAPVVMENDAALGGLGEARYGAGKKFRTSAYLTVGTGVGGCRIVRRRIDRRSQSLHPGQHIQVRGKTLEDRIGGRSLRRSRVNWRQVTHDLASGLIQVVRSWPADGVVVGGGIVTNGHIIWPRLKTQFQANLRPFPHAPKLLKGRLGPRAGLYGALAIIAGKYP